MIQNRKYERNIARTESHYMCGTGKKQLVWNTSNTSDQSHDCNKSIERLKHREHTTQDKVEQPRCMTENWTQKQ